MKFRALLFDTRGSLVREEKLPEKRSVIKLYKKAVTPSMLGKGDLAQITKDAPIHSVRTFVLVDQIRYTTPPTLVFKEKIK